MWQSVKRRVWALPFYLTVALTGCALVAGLNHLGHGSPWLDAKALASASPAPLVAALAGAALLTESRQWVGVVTLMLLAGGVLWSNELAYGSVWLAPRDQLSELETIGHRFEGDGPALMTEYQPYGVRHFLRGLDPEGASERRTRPVGLRTGGILAKAQYADLDAFDLSAVMAYRTLVLRTSPFESRPPSNYIPVFRGRWYEVWQALPVPAVIDHVSLGSGDSPDGVPSCEKVLGLGTVASHEDGTLVAAERRQPQILDLAGFHHPHNWLVGPDATLVPNAAGTLTKTIRLPIGGLQDFWLGGSFRNRVELLVDGRLVGSARDQLEETAQLTPLGTATLDSGKHDISLRYSGGDWRPGSRGAPFVLGPLVLGEPAAASDLIRVPPGAAASLCGRSFDWIEAVAPS
jgi:hypothetical protein